jgi:oxygen-dependent protoporphyrinogen oxidase
MARSLAARLVEPPALGNRVGSLRRDGGLWRVTLTGPGESVLRTARVVLATPAPEAAELLRGLDPEVASVLDSIEYAPIAGVPLGVAPDDLRERVRGFGFLVPREAGLPLLGCLYMSQLFPGRAPDGRELLHCMYGGRRWGEALDLPDDALLGQAHRDLEQTLGLRGEPVSLGIARWPRAIPQPGRDHVARMAGVQARLARHPGLAVAGAYVAGVSVADSLASGIAAAASVANPSI